MKKSVYLAGPMTGMLVGQSRDGWRRRARMFLEPKGVEVLSPLRHWDEIPDGHEMGAIGEDRVGGVLVSGRLNFRRDVVDIIRADCIYANFNGSTRMSGGSFSEGGMAYILHKPVVVFYGDDTFHNHLFWNEIGSAFPKTEEEALACVATFLNI